MLKLPSFPEMEEKKKKSMYGRYLPCIPDGHGVPDSWRNFAVYLFCNFN